MYGGVIQTRRVYEQIAKHIERLIQCGDLQPGDRLPSERDLARQFSVSRPSVREAIIALEVAGLIEVKVGDATYVRARGPGDRLGGASSFSLPECPVLEQVETGSLFEGELVGRLAQQGGAKILPVALAAGLSPNTVTADGFPAPQTRFFHIGLAQSSSDALLSSLVVALWSMRVGPLWEGFRAALTSFDNDPELLAERDILLAAIRNGNQRDARAAMARIHNRFRRLLFA